MGREPSSASCPQGHPDGCRRPWRDGKASDPVPTGAAKPVPLLERAGLVRDWTLPEPEARGYGRGAVRVLDLALVRTRAVTKRVVANREEKASRAERRREARRRAKEASRVVRPVAIQTAPPVTPSAPVRREDLTSPAAEQLWKMLQRLQPAPEPSAAALPRPHPPPG